MTSQQEVGHFLFQTVNIPRAEEPTLRKLAQLALNVRRRRWRCLRWRCWRFRRLRVGGERQQVDRLAKAPHRVGLARVQPTHGPTTHDDGGVWLRVTEEWQPKLCIVTNALGGDQGRRDEPARHVDTPAEEIIGIEIH